MIGIKGIYSFRIFAKFRALIEAILVCLRQMIYFIILMSSYVIMFAILNFSIEQKSFKERSFTTQAGTMYQIIFGENPDIEWDNHHGTLPFIIYFMFTILINIVMLNLLIQLVSDTYSDV